MDKMVLDFDNDIIIIVSDSQRDAFEMLPENQKILLMDFLPDKKTYMATNSFTLNFENDTIELNERMAMGDNTDLTQIYDIKPFKIVPAVGLSARRDEVMKMYGFVQNIENELTEKYRGYEDFITRNGMPPMGT